MRTKIVAGNWKMNKTASETAALIDGIKQETEGVTKVEVVVCPPFTDLKDAAACAGSNVALGAQNVHWEASGAFTGEISAAMRWEIGRRASIGLLMGQSAWTGRKILTGQVKNGRGV